MAKVYEQEFKLKLIELLNSRRKVQEVSDEYGLNGNMLRRWRREYEAKSGDFTKKREVSRNKNYGIEEGITRSNARK